MIEEFWDKNDESEHHLFQEWREKNQNGIFLTLGNKQSANLHGARCTHLGSGPPYFQLKDYNTSLTRKRKICGSLNELFEMASKNSISVKICSHCLRDGFIPKNIADFIKAPEKLSLSEMSEKFSKEIIKAQSLSHEERLKHLSSFSRKPKKVEVTTLIFMRNQYVVAEVLARAGGVCEYCKNPAPFNRLSDGSPYLEVHHEIRLSDGGEDTVDNAIALCPNCHRKKHFG